MFGYYPKPPKVKVAVSGIKPEFDNLATKIDIAQAALDLYSMVDLRDILPKKGITSGAAVYSLERCYADFTKAFARSIFDYLCITCLGEARHSLHQAESLKISFGKGMPLSKLHRNETYRAATQFDPKQFLPQLVRLFNEGGWNGSFGGESWGKAAKYCLKWINGDMSDLLFIDFALNLHHNTGCIFNKGVIFHNSGGLQYNLDRRANGDFSNGFACEDYTDGFLTLAEEIETIVKMLPAYVKRPAIKPKGSITLKYRPIEWGDKQVKLIKKAPKKGKWCGNVGCWSCAAKGLVPKPKETKAGIFCGCNDPHKGSTVFTDACNAGAKLIPGHSMCQKCGFFPWVYPSKRMHCGCDEPWDKNHKYPYNGQTTHNGKYGYCSNCGFYKWVHTEAWEKAA